MTEPIFKAPLPPEGSFATPVNKSQEQPPQNPEKGEDIKQKILPYLWYILGGVFVFGLLFGVMMGGGDDAPQAVECRLKHVRNPDIQSKVSLCGNVPKTDPCVLYIMNNTRYEKRAEDYFQDASVLTERSVYVISIENPVYSKLIIPPGRFAEIKIPSIR